MILVPLGVVLPVLLSAGRSSRFCFCLRFRRGILGAEPPSTGTRRSCGRSRCAETARERSFHLRLMGAIDGNTARTLPSRSAYRDKHRTGARAPWATKPRLGGSIVTHLRLALFLIGLLLAAGGSAAHAESGTASVYGSNGGETASGERGNSSALHRPPSHLAVRHHGAGHQQEQRSLYHRSHQ